MYDACYQYNIILMHGLALAMKYVPPKKTKVALRIEQRNLCVNKQGVISEH